MKRIRWFFLAALALPLAVQAQAIVVLPRGETVSGNVLRLGQRVDIDGNVAGDAFVFGSDVTVAGNIGGDLIVAAQRLTVTGTVAGSIRAAAGDIVLSSAVGRNVTVVANTVRQQSESTVKGSFGALAGTVEQRGTVEGSLDVVAKAVVIAGTVVGGGQIRNEVGWPEEPSGATTVKRGATVSGTLLHFGSRPVAIEDGAKVSTVAERGASSVPARSLASWRVFWKVIDFLGLLLIGYLIVWLLPREVASITVAMVKSPVRSMVVGIITLFGTPLVVVIVAMTLVGLPLGLIMLGLYALGIYLARIFAAVVVGSYLKKAAEKRSVTWLAQSPARSYLAGLLTVTIVVEFLLRWPYQGWGASFNSLGNVLVLVLLLWGFGGIMIGKWRLLRPRNTSAHVA